MNCEFEEAFVLLSDLVNEKGASYLWQLKDAFRLCNVQFRTFTENDEQVLFAIIGKKQEQSNIFRKVFSWICKRFS